MGWLNLNEGKAYVRQKLRKVGVFVFVSDIIDVIDSLWETIHGGSGSSFQVDGSIEAQPALRLVGDEENPAYNTYYGMNGAGSKGFHLVHQVWFGIKNTEFTATTTVGNSISCSNAHLKTGYGLRYKVENVWKYGIITAINSGVLTVVGESALGIITELQFCHASNIETLIFDCSPKTLQVAGSVGFTDKTNNGNFKPTKWLSAPAKIVECQAICLDKSTATPAINLKISGASGDVFSSNINISANNTYYSAEVSSNPANNVIDYGKTLDLRVITAVTTAKEVSFFIQIIKNI